MQLDCMTIGFQEFYALVVVLSLETRCEDCCQGIFKGEAVGGIVERIMQRNQDVDISPDVCPRLAVCWSMCVPGILKVL